MRPNLKTIVRMLEEQRRDLLDQLAAVDKAIAALGTAGSHAAEPPAIAPEEPFAETAAQTLSRKVKAKRTLSESHRQALIVAGRRNRQAKDVTSGLAREMPDDTFVPAIGTRAHGQPPRLVKKTVKRP